MAVFHGCGLNFAVVTEALLQEVFQSTGLVEGCKLIRKEKSSFGFVDYYDRRSAALAIIALNGRQLNQQDAQSAINDLTGKWLGSRQIRCNWATKGANAGEDKQNSDSKSVVTQLDLHRHFHSLGAGVIEEVRIQRDKGFGFVRYSNHSEAALAIQMGNGRILCGKPIKCSWGSKPTPPGTASTPLPPPASASFSGLSATDLLSYDRASLLGKMTASEALMYAQSQQALKQAAMGMGAGASQAIYDGGFQNVNAAQQFMYY
ncbi:hypothetical protein C4D60_Mb11t08380 [Musa balbisiana]|uniref:RRM domain-containing protein n=1 Tax=Musa balbisiana TaxID=52838 RepID=A0A4S8J3I8_MUSBA|nr:hypothetical protein C4D60_Mb11t08380 [Musa balbisiana]